MTLSYTPDSLNTMIMRHLQVDDITWGEGPRDFIVRYRGKLYSEDTETAYNQLTEALKPMGITPLFQWDDNRHAIILVSGKPTPRPSNSWINLILFLVTLISVILAGAIYTYEGSPDESTITILLNILTQLWRGIPFAIALLAILSAHEFGHYIAGRFHKTAVTLPYFIPFPLSPLGTMGAFINMKEPPKNKRILLDIGIAGPLAGLIVAIPILLLGLSLSKVEPLPINPPDGQILQLEGNSILYLLSKFLVFNQLLPSPASYGAIPPLLYWIRYFFTGQPVPLGGVDVMLHPIAWAGWAGILVTALNLLPVGQLDGGHIAYVLLGRKTKTMFYIILFAVVLLGIFWSGWWLWAVLLVVFGRSHAEPLDQITTLDSKRKALAILTLVVFILVFTPVPLIAIGGGL
jgi:membrane-associated protease RseP (regulator of RpoE activity)